MTAACLENRAARLAGALSISLLVLVPCLWQPRVASADLASHSYNAWLAQLVSESRAPGLAIQTPSTNLFTALILESTMGWLGLPAAEKIAAAVAVLTLFGGAVIFLRSLAPDCRWLFPAAAALAYAWPFHRGLFNHQIALGLALAYLSGSFGRRPMRGRVLLLAPAWLANPLPVLWALASAGYVGIVRRLEPRHRSWLLGAAIVGLALSGKAALMILGGYDAAARHPGERILLALGPGSLLVFGPESFWLEGLSLVFVASLLLRYGRAPWSASQDVPLAHLYLLAAAAVLLLPSSIRVPDSQVFVGVIHYRLSSIAAVLGLGLLARTSVGIRHKAFFAAIAIAYVGSLYPHHAGVNAFEARSERLLAGLPPGSRIVDRTLYPAIGLRFSALATRACIGHCFSYANYEPAAGRLFRVRATGPNPFVLWSFPDLLDVWSGKYRVRERDVPLSLVSNCADDPYDVCLEPLRPGEMIDTGPIARHAGRERG